VRAASSRDLGDLDAWQLTSGLYLQAAGPCGVLQIFKQARNGSLRLVTVPHTTGDNHVLTALGSRLLIQAPGNAFGVANAIPFYSRDSGNL